MVQKILVLISGVVFGLGLTISSMTNPAKVIGFLDIFGVWDPSLGFVMGGAILIASPFLYIFKNKSHLILTSKIELPNKKKCLLCLSMQYHQPSSNDSANITHPQHKPTIF